MKGEDARGRSLALATDVTDDRSLVQLRIARSARFTSGVRTVDMTPQTARELAARLTEEADRADRQYADRLAAAQLETLGTLSHPRSPLTSVVKRGSV